MCQRLCSLGVKPSEASAITQEIQKWVECNGDEWTVDRLKSFKNWFSQYHSGNKEFKIAWVKRDSVGPKGPLSVLWRRKGSMRNAQKVFMCLNVHTSFVSPKVTSRQWKKFHESATKPPLATMSIERMNELTQVHRSRNNPASDWGVKASTKAPDLLSYPWSDTRSVPCFPKSVPESSMLWLRQELNCDLFNQNYRSDSSGAVGTNRWAEVLPLNRLSEATDSGNKLKGIIVHQNDIPLQVYLSAGNISFIQEPGFKLRVIANPRRILQLALQPMQKQLLDLLRDKVTTDYTFDQYSAITVIQGWMKNKQKIYSVDLSDATNVFPLDFQSKVLTHVGCLPTDIELFEKISRSPWYVPHLKTSIKFEKGQPLGLSPSFPAFALAHNVLLTNLCKELKIENHFCVLGDDVCIGNDSLNLKYRNVLNELGCPVSQQKTLESYKVANFAGYTIMEHEAFPVGKWHTMSDRNFVDVVRMLGPKSFSLLRPRQRNVVKMIAEVPDVFGGLGFNPRGLSLEQRIHDNMEVIRALKPNEAELLLEHQDQVIKKNLLSFLGDSNQTVRSDYVDMFKARPGPRSMLTSVNDFHQITLALVAESKVEKPYLSRARESDPRGATVLSSLERKLKSVRTDTPSSSHVSSPSKEEIKAIYSQLVTPVAKPLQVLPGLSIDPVIEEHRGPTM